MAPMMVCFKKINFDLINAFQSLGQHQVLLKVKKDNGGYTYLVKRELTPCNRRQNPTNGASIDPYKAYLRSGNIVYSIMNQFPELNPSAKNASSDFMHYWWVESKDIEKEIHGDVENASFLSLLKEG